MPMTMPLEGVRVLDLTHHTVGPFCTRLLGDYGADVIKVERPGGDPARHLPPFAGDRPGIERSGTFLFLNTNKRSIVIDLKAEGDRDRALALARTADVVVESFRPGTLTRLGLGYERLAEINPRIVLTSISNFGQDGPYRDWEGTDLTLYGMGGSMISAGDVDHEPVKLGGRLAGYQAGYVAALATTVALRAAELRGAGEHVDVSMFEALSHSVDGRLMQMLTYQYNGRVGGRGTRVAGAGSGVYPCADGWFLLSGGNLPGYVGPMFRMVGCEHLLDRPEWQTPNAVREPERIEEFNEYLYPWMMQRTKAEVRALCHEYGVPAGPMNTTADLLRDESFLAREFFGEIDHPGTGRVRYPGYNFRLRIEDEPMPPRRRAPLLGEHTDEVLAEIEPAGAAVAREAAAAPPAPVVNRLGDALPLEGLRILDFTVVWAGPYATMHLADWGAEVIRVESQQHFAVDTRGHLAHPSELLARTVPQLHSYPDDDPGPRPWNRAAHFNGHARGKRSMTVDLTRPEGQEILEQFVAKADGLIENNLPPSIEKQGITWDRLSKINPRLIMVRIPTPGSRARR